MEFGYRENLYTPPRATPLGPLQPSRISSEAPEVVPEQAQPPRQETLPVFAVSNYEGRDLKRGGPTSGSRHQKQVDDRRSELRSYPFSPEAIKPGSIFSAPTTPGSLSSTLANPIGLHSTPAYSTQPPTRQDEYETRRVGGGSFRLLTTVLLVAFAFLLGGGIGGGVGGALVAQERSKPQPTATSTAPAATSTVIIDTAGCPLVNNSTYTSSVSSIPFLRLCGTEILSPMRQNIEISNSTQTSFDACLDTCAAYKGCIGATWIIFSPTAPAKNSVCFLKGGIGVETASSVSGDTACSGYLKSAI